MKLWRILKICIAVFVFINGLVLVWKTFQTNWPLAILFLYLLFLLWNKSRRFFELIPKNAYINSSLQAPVVYAQAGAYATDEAQNEEEDRYKAMLEDDFVEQEMRDQAEAEAQRIRSNN